ncbi:MAG: hypothetical protein FWD53_01925, partial [Phycisphaerales bacterium]|nr:hypothetical protein [Phycisphaerales bacterium]
MMLTVMEDAVADKTSTAFGERVAYLLQEKIGHDRYDLWFDRKTRLTLVGNAMVVEVANAF